jgi:acyl-CoA reductase-like NAD-dependent aldehyde dehydrogenase
VTLGTVAVCTLAAVLWIRHVERTAVVEVGDVATEQVALGAVIDERSRDKIHGLVTASVDKGARLPAGGECDRLFYRPTELAEVPLTSPVFTEEVFCPVAPVTRVTSVEEGVRMAAESDYGLSLCIVTRDVIRGLALAEQIPTGQVAARHEASHSGGHTRGHQPQPSTFGLRWRSSQFSTAHDC